MRKALQKVKVLQDESSHWYIIPNEEVELFHELNQRISEGDYNAENEFMERYGEYRTGGSINNIQLYAEI